MTEEQKERIEELYLLANKAASLHDVETWSRLMTELNLLEIECGKFPWLTNEDIHDIKLKIHNADNT